MLYHSLALAVVSVASAIVIRRSDPGFQEIPSSAQPDNTFSNGAPQLGSEPPVQTTLPVPDVYGSRDIDLPFGRLYHGAMKFFSKGQLNTKDQITDYWITDPRVTDSAKQSACGIPDNAFSISKVAIHPYFLKFVPLSRYCMQDVCISFWNGKTGSASSDMILKVTDVCSTDPNDPTHCATPGDIKIDRTKAKIMEKLTDGPLEDYPQLMGDEFTDGETYWFFTKCWADALVQPAYADNWFAKPALPNNLKWSMTTANDQYAKNQISYPLHDPPFPTYDNNSYTPEYDDKTSPPIPDWAPGDPEPEWCPVAGGKGWGNPTGKNCGGGSQPEQDASGGSSSTAVAPSTAVHPVVLTPNVASTFGSPSTSPSSISSFISEVQAFETSAAADLVSSSSSTFVTTSTVPTSFPKITNVSNSTGMAPGVSGGGQVSPKQIGAQVVGEGDGDEVCDAESEEPVKNVQQVVEEDQDDECEW